MMERVAHISTCKLLSSFSSQGFHWATAASAETDPCPRMNLRSSCNLPALISLIERNRLFLKHKTQQNRCFCADSVKDGTQNKVELILS